MESLRTMTLRWLRRVPVLSAAMGATMCLCLSMEHEALSAWCRAVYEIAVVTAGFAVVYLVSRYLRLCMMQMTGLYYTYCLMLCMWMMRYHGMSEELLHYAHVTMLVVGMVYVLMVVSVLVARRLLNHYK